MWPGLPSGVPARTWTPRSERPATAATSSSAPPSEIQEKFASVGAVLRPSSAQALLDPDPLDDRLLDPPADVVGVPDRLRGGGLGDRVDVERLAHRVHCGTEGGRAEPVADPQPGQPVALAERAQENQIGEVAQQVDGGVGVVALLELHVGLVQDHRDVAGHPLAELRDRPGAE